ncbi:MAG: metallophosphoesterase [Candidatus Pacebacteria bacterium]|nr:metallophosphoesterase [Candidatus Paceibacterota bacterium]MDR3583519.1 metallophosphoesterase [Candidatus Paceibacterota bacterium]
MEDKSQNTDQTKFPIAFVLFLVAGLIIILAAHFLVWFTLVKIFALTVPARIILGLVFFILAISFFPVNALATYQAGRLLRVCYFLSGLWLGFFATLFFSFVALWILYVVNFLVGMEISWRLVTTFLVLLSAAVTLWGMFNAYHPRIRRHHLKIPKLPPDWRDKKIVQLSDLHLGLSNGAAFLKHVVKMTNRQKPDLIFITGDLFDGGDGNLETFVPLLDSLKADQGVYFITGNHETYLGLEEVFAILGKTKIQILDDRAVELSGLRIIGLGYPELSQAEDMTNILEKLLDNRQPQILLFHSPIHLEEFSRLGIDVLFCGHTHQGQIFPLGLLTWAIFHGHDRGLSRVGKMRVYVSSGTGTWGPPVKTSGRTEIAVFKLG